MFVNYNNLKRLCLFQFCPGGELFDYIVAKERLTVSFDMGTDNIELV